MLSNIKSLSNSFLISELKSKVLEERKLLNEILELLHEVASRKLYLDMAYSSLFDFCVQELGYSRHAAFRRVEAMKLLKSLPVAEQDSIKDKITSGSLNLTHLTAAQSFFKVEAKENNKNYSVEEKKSVLSLIEGKSKLEVEKELVKLSPQAIPIKQETVKPLTAEKIEVKLVIDTELLNKLNRLKQIKSHINPSMSTTELLTLLIDKELSKCALASTKKPVSCKQSSVNSKKEKLREIREKEELKIKMGIPRSRYIPIDIKRQVYKRDYHHCSFTNQETGEICQSKHLLQIDHIQEFSNWGLSTDPSNLRLLCHAHHRQRT